MKNKIKCPACGAEINPASIMGKLSVKKNPRTPEMMRSLALLRHNKNKKKDESK